MIHKKLLSLLVLLMTAATGAWADELSESFETNHEVSVYTGEHFKITVGDRGSGKGFYLAENKYATIEALNGEIITKVEFTKGYYYINNFYCEVGTTNISGDVATVSGVNNTSLTFTASGALQIKAVKVYYTAPEPPIEVTTNAASEGATFTEATFAMPDFDATANYDIVRDLATSTKVDLIIGTGSDAVTATADTRLRIAKSNNVYAPVSALSCNFVDQIENNTILPTGFNDAKLTPQFYLQGENDAWTLVTDINTTTKLPNNLQPGQVYYITLKAADGSYYDGETQPSYTVTLFEGYEVAVPAGEYVTYYRDEPLYADPVSSTDAKLYTISSVSTTDGTATLSDAIATAPSSTPLLVYNAGNTDATFLLIPADAEPNLALTVAPEFIGTTEATTIAASTSTKNNYALNGKQFVWVKNAVEIGANKAWLAISSGELQARTITLVFDETTKITNTNLTNLTNGNWYDLNGRKLQNIPTKKGVYIFNGRKVVIK